MPQGKYGLPVRTGDLITTKFKNLMGNPIAFTEQKSLGCFNACISMLTGIPNDMFPNVTFLQLPNSRLAGIKQMKRILGTDQDTIRLYGAECYRVPWREVVKHYMNYGIKLHFHNRKPKGPSMRVLIWRSDPKMGHVVVELPNGEMWCPTRGYSGNRPDYEWGMPPLNLWLTVEQM